MYRKSNYIFIGLLGVLLGISIYLKYSNGYQLLLTNYLAITFWIVVLITIIVKNKRSNLGVGLLLISGTFNILNFVSAKVVTRFLIGNVFTVAFNPLLFLIALCYYFVNLKSINKAVLGFIKTVLNGSEKEQADQRQKKVEFYLKTFTCLTPDELETAIHNISEYPLEAQIALKNFVIQDKVTALPK